MDFNDYIYKSVFEIFCIDILIKVIEWILVKEKKLLFILMMVNFVDR